MANTFAFNDDINKLSGLHRIKLDGANIHDYIRIYDNELTFIKELPENIKKNVINSFNYIYLNKE